MAALGSWVITRGLEDLTRIDTARPGGPPLRLHLNLSARQLHDPELPDAVRAALEAAGVAPERLVLELTEVGVVEDIDLAVTRMGELRAIGVELAMDDFGTGVSSLTSLHRLPIGMLKVDRAFVARIGGLPPDNGLVAALLTVAHAFGLEPVAEGVETEAQRVALVELGCRLGQGYRFSRPMPLDDALLHVAGRAPVVR
jgi:EAL domain-containing protein (putative c-di-GMP-specific phosphodiesterase class I)